MIIMMMTTNYDNEHDGAAYDDDGMIGDDE